MIFFGRPLAIRPRIAIWQHHQDDRLYLQFLEAGTTVELTPEIANELHEALGAALAALPEPEAAKDRARRLQILRERLAMLSRAGRGPAGSGEPSAGQDAPGIARSEDSGD